MAPGSKKHARPALKFTNESLGSVGPRSRPLLAVQASIVQPTSVEVARVSFLQATRTWLCNPFEDVVQDRVRRRSPKAKENVRSQQEQTAVARSRRKTKNDPQNQARLSISYGQLEFYSDTERTVGPSCIAEGTPTTSRSLINDDAGSSRIPLLERNDVRNCSPIVKNEESRLTRFPTHIKTSSCETDIVLVPDTPESEYGMTLKMRQIREFKRRLF